jgi:hypothetical protein
MAMTTEEAKALEAVRNVKKSLLEEIAVRYPFGKPEPIESTRVEKFLHVVLKWLILDDQEATLLLKKAADPFYVKVKVGVEEKDAELELEEFLIAWVRGRGKKKA